jgi:dimethylhistidine N-methyltransferase
MYVRRTREITPSPLVMTPPPASGAPPTTRFAEDVRRGLGARPKRLPCVHLYDAEGSRLFEAICELPEYYLTRAERSILVEHADDIVAKLEPESALVELGSGSSQKTRLLIEAFLRAQPRLRYVPIDVSREMLSESAHALAADYPRLEVHALAADYHAGLRALPLHRDEPKLVAFLGSSIGNLERDEAASFLREVAVHTGARDRVLLGVDLRKDRRTLERAYDDAAGVTARFDANVLARINRELGGHFALDRFHHRADYDAALGRVSMHLVAEGAQQVRIDALGMVVDFEDGETIHTEDSWKYAPEEIDALAASAGLATEARYFDAERRFSLSLLRAP